jgi:hypothetical protein
MDRILIVIIFTLVISCSGKEEAKNREQLPKTDSNASPVNSQITHRTDTLTNVEKSFLTQIAKESASLIISNQVERFFSEKDSIPLVTRLVFPQEFLVEKGYVYLEIEFYGKISDVNVSYRYSLGRADTGFGSVNGDGINNYLHTHKGCGVTACITQVCQNGKKIFEKEEQVSFPLPD